MVDRLALVLYSARKKQAAILLAERFKPRLFALVDWECSNPAIRTQEAWDLAYETIYEALPPCRDCLCL